MHEDDTLHDGGSEDVEVRCHARVSAGRVPPERCLHTCTLLVQDGSRVVYLYAGRGKGGALDDMHQLDLEGNVWTTPKANSDKPAGRFGHSGVAHGNSLYYFGGHSRGQATFNFNEGQAPSSIFSDKKRGERAADTEAVDEVITYNVDSAEWKELETEGAAPCPRYKHGSCLIPDRRGAARMFIFGGQDEEGTALNDQYVLQLGAEGAKTWCAVAATPGTMGIGGIQPGRGEGGREGRLPDAHRLLAPDPCTDDTRLVPRRSVLDSTGARPSPRYGHSITLLPAQRKIICLGGTDGKHIDASSVMDPEFPSHKTTKSLHPMACHTLDIDTMVWSTVACKNAQTGAEPSPRCYHSATLLGKNLFVTGGQVHFWLLANNHYIHGAYILEIVKNQWEHNTIKGDSFIPYPGCALAGHTACAIDSSSLIIFGGNLETTAGFEQVNTFWDVATDAKQKLNPSQLPLPTAGGQYSTTFKLLVVGDAGVGKTCLITRFVDDVFSSTNKSTIGVDFKATTVEMDGKAVQLQVWDTAGQERFRALTTSYYRGAHGVIVVYDTTDQASFDHLQSWIKDVDLYSGEEVTKLLIGNKDDDKARKVVDPEQAREFAAEHSMLFMEASAMRATNVSAAFRLLVAEVMHQADTLASQPPAFEHKLRVNMERSRRASGGCGACL